LDHQRAGPDSLAENAEQFAAVGRFDVLPDRLVPHRIKDLPHQFACRAKVAGGGNEDNGFVKHKAEANQDGLQD